MDSIFQFTSLRSSTNWKEPWLIKSLLKIKTQKCGNFDEIFNAIFYVQNQHYLNNSDAITVVYATVMLREA